MNHLTVTFDQFKAFLIKAGFFNLTKPKLLNGSVDESNN